MGSDLIISMWIPSRNVMKIVVAELKVGSINILLRERLEGTADVEHEIVEISSELGPKAALQAQRMVRQDRRLWNFVDVVKTDEGVDPQSGRRFKMARKTTVFKDYREKLAAVLARAKTAGWAAVTLDECLHLIAQVPPTVSPERRGLKIAHDFYHLRHGTFCGADGTEAAKNAEIMAIKDAPLAVNLFQFCISQSLAMPPFLWFSEDLMIDVLFGRLEVFAQFDYEKFFALAKQWANLDLEFVTGKRARRIVTQKISGKLIEYRDARFVLSKRDGQAPMTSGARILCDLYLKLKRPRDVLRSLVSLLDTAAADQTALRIDQSTPG